MAFKFRPVGIVPVRVNPLLGDRDLDKYYSIFGPLEHFMWNEADAKPPGLSPQAVDS